MQKREAQPRLRTKPAHEKEVQCLCLLTGQVQKAADKHLYGLKRFWSCCPVLRILEQTWWPYWATLVPLSPLPSGDGGQEQLQWSQWKHCSMAEGWVQSRSNVWSGMETWEGSITEAWLKSKRNCSLHFRHHMALSSCLGTHAQAVREAENENHSPNLQAEAFPRQSRAGSVPFPHSQYSPRALHHS